MTVTGVSHPPTRKKVELKPCPFCGMEVKIVEKLMYYSVSHADVNVIRDCDLGIRIYARTKCQAIKKWNRRAGEQK